MSCTSLDSSEKYLLCLFDVRTNSCALVHSTCTFISVAHRSMCFEDHKKRLVIDHDLMQRTAHLTHNVQQFSGQTDTAPATCPASVLVLLLLRLLIDFGARHCWKSAVDTIQKLPLKCYIECIRQHARPKRGRSASHH